MGKSNGQHRKAVLDVLVQFGGVSIGQATARLGVRIDRGSIELPQADDCFCGRRLTGEVILGQRDDMPGQTKMFDADHTVSGVFDVKRIGVDPDTISTGLVFNLADVDIAELAKFSKGAGRLVIFEVSELPDDAAEEEHGEEFASAPPSTLRAAGPWRDHPLDAMFAGAILKSLKKAGIETVGALADYSASERRLTDIEGIGPGKAANIEERMLGFWSSNPQFCDGGAGEAEASGDGELEFAEAASAE